VLAGIFTTFNNFFKLKSAGYSISGQLIHNTLLHTFEQFCLLNVRHKLMNLTGWSRIMIAITVAWLLVLAGFVSYEHQSSNVFCQFDGEGAVCQHIFWLWAYVAQGKFEFTLMLGRLLTTALVPVAVLWFCFGAVVWIKAGFKRTP